jgi:hypothetical protein
VREYRERAMNIKNGAVVVSLICLLSCSVFGCASIAERDESSAEECWGVWTNEQYNTDPDRAAKIVYFPDMTWAAYVSDFSVNPRWRGTISIIDSWKDEEGSFWYTVTTHQVGMGLVVYELWKISDAGLLLEGVWDIGYIPERIDPASRTYPTYRRDSPGTSPVTASR